MRTHLTLSVLAAFGLTVAGCSNTTTNTVAGAPAAVSGASPSSAFRGRTIDVVLSGSGTSWDATTTATFGAGITVNKLTVSSPAALVANITVDPAATLGSRDITVTSAAGGAEPYTMAFNVTSAIDATVTGTAAQGSVLFVTVKNNDLAHVFDDTSTGGGLFGGAVTYTNIDITAPTGSSVNVSNVTPFEIDATILIDVDYTPGAFDLAIESGPKTATTRDSFVYPALFTVAARTATALTNGVTGTLTAPASSMLYTYTPKGANEDITIDAPTTDGNSSAGLVVLDKTGSFNNIIASGVPSTYHATSTDPVYVVVYDTTGAGGVDFTLDITDLALTVQTGGEGNDTTNNSSSTPTVLTAPPVIVQGASLSSATDVDWYSVTIPTGGNKKIRAQTVAGDAKTDTTVAFFQTDGTTQIGNTTDNDFQEDASSDSLAPGTYLIQIAYSTSSTYDSSQSHYDLIVTLE